MNSCFRTFLRVTLVLAAVMLLAATTSFSQNVPIATVIVLEHGH